VPSFQDWRFPSTLPETWTRSHLGEPSYTAPQSTITAAVRARDATCRVSGHFTGTEVAHLCPEHEREWFLRNSMGMWNTDLTLDPDSLLNDLSNVILLRSDLHTAFDERKFVFYPKSDDGFVVHMLEPTPDLGQLYHNVHVQRPLQCNVRFLYARLAWALFPSLSGFLSKPGVSRYLQIVKFTLQRPEWVEEEVTDSGKLRAKVSASRSRSPKKRRAAEEDRCDKIQRDELFPDWKKRRIYDAPGMGRSAPEHDQPVTQLPTQPSREQLEDLEFEEDLQLQRKYLPNFGEASGTPPSWYPGWRRVERLRASWISQGRPASLVGFDSNGTRPIAKHVLELESMGLEVMDSSDD
jgi:hypothetical protein